MCSQTFGDFDLIRILVIEWRDLLSSIPDVKFCCVDFTPQNITTRKNFVTGIQGEKSLYLNVFSLKLLR